MTVAVDGDPPTFFFLPSPRVFLSRPFSSLVPWVFALRISSASVRPEGRGEGKGRGSSSMGDSSSELCSFLPFSVGREGGGGNPPVFPEWGSGSLFRQQPPPPPLQGCIGRREGGAFDPPLANKLRFIPAAGRLRSHWSIRAAKEGGKRAW